MSVAATDLPVPADDAAVAAAVKQARTAGNVVLAEQLATDGLQRFPHSRALWSEAAYNAKRQGDWVRAAERLRGLQQTYRKGAPAKVWSRLLQALRQAKDTDRALAASRSALQAFPDSVVLHQHGAAVFEAARAWPEAAHSLRIVLADKPKPLEKTFVRLARALHLAGSNDAALAVLGQARSLYRKSLRLRPFAVDGKPTAFARAVALNQSFRFEQAQAAIAALRADPAEAQPRRQLDRFQTMVTVNAGQYEAGMIALGRNGKADAAPGLAGLWKVKKTVDGDLRFTGVVQDDLPEVTIFVNQLFLKSVRVKTVDGVRRFKFTVKRRMASRFPSDPDIRITAAGNLLLCENREALARHQVQKGGLLRRLRRGFIVTKKGTLRRPMPNNLLLRKRIADYLTRLDGYFFDRFGYRLWLSYGTLLGCIREGDFIFHDDDVDVSYLSTKTDPVAVIDEMVEMCRQMVADGWNMRVSVNGIIKPDSDFNMDIYAAWIQDGKLYMQNTTCFPFTRDDVEPCREVQFNGAPAWVPANAEGFLASKYGANWRVPDPGYQRQMAPGAREVLALAKPTAAQIDELRDLRTPLIPRTPAPE